MPNFNRQYEILSTQHRRYSQNKLGRNRPLLKKIENKLTRTLWPISQGIFCGRISPVGGRYFDNLTTVTLLDLATYRAPRDSGTATRSTPPSAAITPPTSLTRNIDLDTSNRALVLNDNDVFRTCYGKKRNTLTVSTIKRTKKSFRILDYKPDFRTFSTTETGNFTNIACITPMITSNTLQLRSNRCAGMRYLTSRTKLTPLLPREPSKRVGLRYV